MARRRRRTGASWRGSLIAAAGMYAILRWGVPALFERTPMTAGLVPVSITVAPFVGGFLLLEALAAFLFTAGRRRRVGGGFRVGAGHSSWVPPPESRSAPGDRPTEWSLQLLRKLEWKRFEEVCAAYFRETGLRAESLPFGADGGVDIRLFEGRATKPHVIVQCKAWTSRDVGVAPVRELFGVMADEGVPAGIVLATGGFTEAALAFAKDNPLDLIDGARFLKMVGHLSVEAQRRLLDVATEGDYTTPTCPSCGRKMTDHTGNRGRSWKCLRCNRTLGRQGGF